MSDPAAVAKPLARSGPLGRRGLLAGAGAVGAAVVAVKLMPGAAVAEVQAAAPVKAVDTGGGYQLSDHVRRYYETTRS